MLRAVETTVAATDFNPCSHPCAEELQQHDIGYRDGWVEGVVLRHDDHHVKLESWQFGLGEKL